MVSEKVEETKEQTTQKQYTLEKGEHYYFVKGAFQDIPIVNKKYPLDKQYNPGVDEEALSFFKLLQQDMRKAGYTVANGFSGYRDYQLQTYFYTNYVAKDGKEKADTYSARPGHSEHQLGLAFDVWEDETGTLLTNVEAVKWLKEHAHEYGFVVRYIEGKEHITGYQPETWHVRYVGKEATNIYQSGLTLEEYFNVDGGDYID